eukprot:GSChrysophyteH1.ASY1.ANO1.1146.1 assembled CDS
MFDWREDVKKVMNQAGAVGRPTSMAKPCAEAGINAGVPAEVYNFFVDRVRSNLHMVLCLSPIGDAFRTRLRMFPALVNCCTIDWFTDWPEEALRSVANYFLHGVEGMNDDVKSGVIDVCVDMQLRVVNLSKRFLAEMSRNYYQQSSVFDAKARYDNGLNKLPTVETDALIVQVTADRIVANEQSVLVGNEAAKCEAIATEANNLKESCEADLAEAIPALEAAEKALKSLDKSDITEMKAMKKPSMAIKMTMAAIAVMMDVKKDKKLLGDSKFLQRLIGYDRDNMKPEIGSQAAAGLAKWVHAMVKYDRVAKNVAPKKAALKEAEATLKDATEQLNEKQSALKIVLDKVAALEAQLKEAEDKKAALVDQVADCEA